MPRKRKPEDGCEGEMSDEAPAELVGNRLINLEALESYIQNNLVYRTCKSDCGLQVWEDGPIEGWASQLGIECLNRKCKQYETFCTSPNCLPTEKDKNPKGKQVNRALVLAMRAISKGHQAAETVSGFLDMPSPINTHSWKDHHDLLTENLANEGEQCHIQASRNVKASLLGEAAKGMSKDDLNKKTVDIQASFDGSWKNQGLTSKHCIVSAISTDTGEVLDTEYITNLCPECDERKRKGQDERDQEYLEWFTNHFPKCPRNFTGPSQSMEAEGVSRMFERSEKKLGVRYTKYLGDGDSSSYKRVCKEKPYGEGVEIQKEECVGHEKKRMGKRLRNLLGKKKGIPLSDGKCLGGQGRLTKDRVNILQDYYGNALMAMAGKPDVTIQEVQHEIMAGLYHYSRNHEYCPKRPNTWCKFQADQLNGTDTHKEVKNPFSQAMVDLMKPIYVL